MVRRLILIALIAVAASLCSVLRGLRMDGPNGPGLYSFEKRDHEMVVRGERAFSFPEGLRAGGGDGWERRHVGVCRRGRPPYLQSLPA